MIPRGVDVFVAPSRSTCAGASTARRWSRSASAAGRVAALSSSFRARRDAVKILFADGTGLCLFYKRGPLHVPDARGERGQAGVAIEERALDDTSTASTSRRRRSRARHACIESTAKHQSAHGDRQRIENPDPRAVLGGVTMGKRRRRLELASRSAGSWLPSACARTSSRGATRLPRSATRLPLITPRTWRRSAGPEELSCSSRRIYVAKAERVDTAQLEMEFAEKLRQLDALAGTLEDDAVRRSDEDDGDEGRKEDRKRSPPAGAI